MKPLLCYISGHKVRNVIDNAEFFAEWTNYKDLKHPMCVRCGEVFK